jgi:hypothetical protein
MGVFIIMEIVLISCNLPMSMFSWLGIGVNI